MKKTFNKGLAVLLAAIVLLALSPPPAPAFAAAAEQGAEAQGGEAPSRVPDIHGGPNLTGTQLYFGEWEGKPIVWIVIDVDEETGTATLWAKDKVANMSYDILSGGNHAYWKGSYLCAWLNATKWNSMVTGALLRDFTETGFLKNAFSEAERAVILPEYGMEFEPVPYFNRYTGEQLTDYIDTRQAVVLPSIDELGSWCTIGSWDIDVSHRASGSHTWLRTPADFSKFRLDDVYDSTTFKYVWYMHPNGIIARDRIGLQNPLGAEYDIRPAIKINLSYLRAHAAFATPVVFGGGKHPRAGGVLKDGSYFEASMSGGAVQEVAAIEGNLCKLTLFSTALSDIAIADNSPRAVLPGQTVSLAFSNATVGEGCYVSCILTDGSGAVKYYSRLSQAASGTASINLPRDIPAGEYTIGIFCEKYNGEFKIDECGAIADIPLTVKARPCQVELREPQLIGFGGKLWNVIGWDGAKVSSDGNTATLLLSGESRLAGAHYGFSRFNANAGDVVYSGSELQGAMDAAYNTLGAGERALVAGRTLESGPFAFDPANSFIPNVKYIAGPDVRGAKFWPLSHDEEMTLEIGETLFGVDELFINDLTRPPLKEIGWWTRVPDNKESLSSPPPVNVRCGTTGSTSHSYGAVAGRAVTEEFYVRPVFNLSLSRILFATPAENGKPAGAGGGLVPIEDSYAIKYTAIDKSLTLSSSDTSARSVGTGGGTVNIAYSGANGGYVSCVIADCAGKALYYGKLAAAAGGTAAVSVPALPEGCYTILLFSETDNGGCYTDFCSEPVYIPLTVGSPAANTGPPAVTAVSSDAGAAANPDGGYLRITFNKTMGAAGTVCLEGKELTAAGKWTGNTYNIQYPTLEHGRTYHVIVSGFRDASGAEMLPDNSGSLTTAPFSLFDVVSFAGQEWWVVGYSSRDEETLSKKLLGHGGSTIYRYSRTGLYSHGTDNITLLLKGGVPYGNTAFGNSLDYAGSLLRGKLEEIANGYGAREQALIRGRTLTAGSAAIHGADAPDQKLWPLLAWEYIHPIGDSFPYGKKDTPSSFGGAMYLTRSGNGKPTKSAAVSSGSAGYDYAEIFDLEFNQPAGIRPVLVLDLSSVFLTNAAQGARAKPGGMGLSPYIRPERMDHYWSYGYEVRPLKDTMKFTMIDSGLTLSANAAPINAVAGGTVGIPYTNASIGANRYVSCLISDFYGEVKYYGKLAGCSANASGTAGFTVPALEEGRYTVKLFCEEANGAFDLDFCSEPVAISMNVGGTPPAAVSLTPSGAGVATSGNIAVTFNKNMDNAPVGTVTLNGQPLSGGEWLDKRNFVVPYAVAANTACAVTVSGFRDEFGTQAPAVSNSFSTFAYSFAVYDTVMYAGQEWWVIGSGGKGVYPGANTATLLLKHDGWEIPPPFGAAATVTNYSGSELQTAMETVANGFPAKERARIKPRTLTAANDGISGPDAANQKLWPLSADEYLATAYWDISTFGMYEYTEIVSGVLFRLKQGYVYPLRTQEEFVTTWEAPYYTNYHYGAGHISFYFDPINLIINGIKYVRPAFQLDLSDVWFATDANGKPAGVESGFLKALAPLSGAPVKFTMFDSGLTLTCTDTAKRNMYAGGLVEIGYSGANGNFVSCVITDENGAVKYYGKLSPAVGGTARLVLPEELPDGDYTIKLFSEEVNGANCTDFAGAPVDIALTVDNTPQSVAYVDAAGGDDANDGASWQTAFATLQMALNRIAEPGQIYVAAGTYYPAKTAGGGTDSRDKAFVIPADVKICGGYDASTGVRDIRANETVLSGDIGTKGDDSDNSYHVVISAGDVGNATLDGFTISGGNADGTGNISLDGFVTGIGRQYGGGVFIGNGSPNLSNCVITGNAAAYGGGGICSNASDYVMINCLIMNNAQTGGVNGGGGIGAWGGSPKIVNCSIASNSANSSSGAYIVSGANIALINSIIAGNTTAGGQTNVTNFTTSIVGGTYYTDNTTYKAIDQANIFVGGGDWRLKPGSPAIDAGTYPVAGVTIPATDLAGRPRIAFGFIDLGAYEYPATVFYADCLNGSDANDGESWQTAFATLQKALDAVVDGGEVYVAAGTYYPSKTAGSGTDPRDKAFVITADVKIHGGYDASTGERHIRANETILSGDIGVKADDSDNSYHVVISGGDVGTALLDGFTITGGNANGIGNISLDGFVTGIGREYGGGIFISNGSPTLSNCVITGNAAVNGGGGICSNASDYVMINCLVASNSQTDSGAGGGGGIGAWGGSPKVVNCTVAGNSARASGGVYNASGADIALINSIVAYNTVAGGNTNVTSINTSIVGGSFYTDYTTAFAIDQATIFAGGGDWRLKPGSPAINAGTYPVAGVTIPATDLDGNPRVVNSLIDLGAYEYFLLGDINGDNRVNLSDLSFLSQYFIGGYGIEERFPMIYTTGDMNRNGELELDDLDLLVYLIVNFRPMAAITAAYDMATLTEDKVTVITVPALEGKPGERVVVPVAIENSPGVKMYQLAMQYDNTKLEFISQSSGPTFAHPANLRNGGPIQVDGDIWEARVTYLGELLAPQTVPGDVILCEFEFEIRDGAAGGETPLTLKPQNSYILSGSGNNVYPEIANGAITIEATEEIESYNFRAYMEAAQTNLKAGDTLNVDIMLSGDLNYTQFNSSITYDAALLEFAGYANLGGLVAEVKKDDADKINVRSVASLNMMTGATCITPVRVVTLKFTVKDILAAESVTTDLSFAAIAVTPVAGVTGVTIAPGRTISVTFSR